MVTLPEPEGLYGHIQLEDPETHFRLLQIKGSLADVHSDELECTLSSHSLEKAPPYRCLSYVWGVDTDNSEIQVNSEFNVSVTKNLRRFLERMRAGSKDPNGYLWIDAICINQQDLDEKRVQVSIMGAIYAKAMQVIAWLGSEFDRLGDGSDNGENKNAETLYTDLKPPAPLVPRGFKVKVNETARTDDAGSGKTETGDTDSKMRDQGNGNDDKNAPATAGTSGDRDEDPTEAAIDFIRVLYPAFKNWMEQGNDPWSAEFSTHAFGAPEMYTMLGIPRIGTKRWAALAHFLNRKWFQRTWIVQEAALAKSLVLVCGMQVLLWDQIVKVCIFLQASGWFLPLMDFLDPKKYAVGPGWRGIVFASMQYICSLKDVNPELGAILPSPLNGSSLSENQIKNLEYKMFLFYLTTSRPFDAKDPRDKVYAPFALLKQVMTKIAGGSQLQLEISYKEKKEVKHVYTEAATLILKKAETLLLLSHVEDRTSTSIEGLPSWVPDFSYRGHAGLLDIPGAAYDALPNTISDCQFDKDTTKIQLDGFSYDRIESFGPDFNKKLLDDKDWRPWIEYCLSAATQNIEINGESFIESLWRTLVGDLDGTSKPASSTMAACFKRYIQVCTVIYLGKECKFCEQPYTKWHEWSGLDSTLR